MNTDLGVEVDGVEMIDQGVAFALGDFAREFAQGQGGCLLVLGVVVVLVLLRLLGVGGRHRVFCSCARDRRQEEAGEARWTTAVFSWFQCLRGESG